MSLARKLSRLVPMVVLQTAACASPALACKNDTSVKQAEDEFRSRYDSQQPVARTPSRYGIWGIAALSAGTGLVAGSVAVGLNRKRRGGR